MGSYLDYVGYTRGWDIESQVHSIFLDIDTVSYRSRDMVVSINKEFVVMRQLVRSQTVFDIDIMGAFSENATSAFLFDYTQSPPTPYYALFLPSSNASMHIDLEEWYRCDAFMPRMMESGETMISLNSGEGDSFTELQVRFCDSGRDVGESGRVDG